MEDSEAGDTAYCRGENRTIGLGPGLFDEGFLRFMVIFAHELEHAAHYQKAADFELGGDFIDGLFYINQQYGFFEERDDPHYDDSFVEIAANTAQKVAGALFWRPMPDPERPSLFGNLASRRREPPGGRSAPG